MLAFDAAGKGPPVVLLHGAFSNRRVWGYQLLDLSRHARVVAVDLPGFGASSFAGDKPWLDEAVEGVVEVAKSLGAAPIIVGWSLGGVVAATVREQLGEGSTVLIGTASRPIDEQAASVLKRRLTGDYPRMASTMVREYTSSTISTETESWLRSLAFTSSAHVHIQALCETRVSVAELINGDVTVIHGRLDRLVPFEERVTHGNQVIFERSGHVPFLEEKQRFGEVLRAVIRR